MCVVQAGEQGYLYASVGAAVLSVLTEPKWFKGSLADMKEVRIATNKMREGQAKKRYMPVWSILCCGRIQDRQMVCNCRWRTPLVKVHQQRR